MAGVEPHATGIVQRAKREKRSEKDAVLKVIREGLVVEFGVVLLEALRNELLDVMTQVTIDQPKKRRR